MGAAVWRRLGGLAVAGVLLWTAAPGKVPQSSCGPGAQGAALSRARHGCATARAAVPDDREGHAEQRR